MDNESWARKIPVLGLCSLLTFGLLVAAPTVAEPALAAPSVKTVFVGGAGAADSSNGLTAGTSKATIGAALALVATGDTVQVAAGQYIENVTISASITLKCANFGIAGSATRASETVIRGVATSSPKSLPAAVLITVSGVVIDGCAFVRHVDSVTSSPIDLNAVPKMIQSSGVTGETIIRNSRFDLATSGSTSACGSGIWGTADWQISSNYFANQKWVFGGCGNTTYEASTGVYNSRVIWAEGAPEISVTGNVFENTGHAVYLTGPAGTGGLIEGNTFYNGHATGWRDDVVLGDRTGVLIRGNTFQAGGIKLDSSKNTRIENNLFCGPTDGSVSLTSLFEECEDRTEHALNADSSTTGTVMRGNAILGAYAVGQTIYYRSLTALEDNWWGAGVIESAILSKILTNTDSGWVAGPVPSSFITDYTFDPAKTGTPGFWPTCVTLSDPLRTVDQAVLPCPQPAQGAVSVVGKPAIHLDLQAKAGDVVGGSPILIEGQGLKPGSTYSLVMRSTPVNLKTGIINNLGTFGNAANLPSGLSAGTHTITLTATGLDGSTLSLVTTFVVSGSGTFTSISPGVGRVVSALATTGPSSSELSFGMSSSLVLLVLGIALFVLSSRNSSPRLSGRKFSTSARKL